MVERVTVKTFEWLDACYGEIGLKISQRFRMKSNVVRFSGRKQSDSIFNDGVADIICSRQPMEPESRYTLREVIVYLVTVIYPGRARGITLEVFFERLFQAASNWIVKGQHCWLNQFLPVYAE